MAKVSFHFSKKKLLLLGFLFAILLVIPLTIYLVQQQQDTRSHAQASTNLSFLPSTKTAQFGEKVSLDVMLSPGSNQVSAVKLVVKFDPTKLTASPSSFVLNPASGLQIQESPVVVSNTIAVNLNIGGSTINPIRTDTKLGTLTFDVTGSSSLPTEVSFDPASQVNSLDGEAQGNTYENVLIPNPNPASITIQGGNASETDAGNATPTPNPNPGTSVTPTPTPTGTQAQEQDGNNEPPVCSNLDTDVSASGPAPYTVNFTAKGTDTDGTIDKVSFNFGEGDVQDEESGGGIGTDTVEITQSHTYDTASTYTATALMTDDSGATSSNSVNCTTTITVSDDGSSNNSTSTDPTSTESASIAPSPLPATGPSQTIMGFGALGGLLFLIGTLLFFAL